MFKPTLAHINHRDSHGNMKPVQAFYRHDESCSFCGSMSTELAVHYLTTPGTQFEGDTWHKGFPETFFITPKDRGLKRHTKFHVLHLCDASDEVFQRFDEISRKVLGIAWFKDLCGVRFNCPRSTSPFGFKRKGVIMEDGLPLHTDGMDTNRILQIIDDNEEKIAENMAGQKTIDTLEPPCGSPLGEPPDCEPAAETIQ